jgi:hypothetical protein
MSKWKRGDQVFVFDGACDRGLAKVRAVLGKTELLVEKFGGSCGRCGNTLAIVPVKFVCPP